MVTGRFDKLAPYGVLLIRVVVGVIIAYHGYPKLVNGVAAIANGIIPNIGLPAPLLWAYLVLATEIIGGLFLALGLLTRLAAFALVIEFVVIVTQVKWANGFVAFAASAIQPGFKGLSAGGFEFEFLLGICCLAFILIGGGRYSLDYLILNRSVKQDI
jgi:putative oxidoreductase